MANHVVVVTGAARGLGAALVARLLDNGHAVVALTRAAQPSEPTETKRLLRIACDVTDRQAVDDAIGAGTAYFGPVFGLYANAAIYPKGTIEEQAAEEAAETFAVNVVGAANAIRAVLPGMKERATGRIVTVGSFAGRDPLPDAWAYSASKAALSSVTRAVANEVKGDFPDILVNEWVPGALNTTMGIPAGHDPQLAASWGVKLLELPPGGPSGAILVEDQLAVAPPSLTRRVARRLRGALRR